MMSFNSLEIQNISAVIVFLAVAYSRTHTYIFICILWYVSNKGVLIVSLMKGH